MSNLAAGSEADIEEVIVGDFFPTIINILETEQDEIAKEAIFAICNAVSGSNVVQLLSILGSGVLSPFMSRLEPVPSDLRDKSMVTVVRILQPINLLLYGYSSYHCGIGRDIPDDVLGTILEFMSDLPGYSIEIGL